MRRTYKLNWINFDYPDVLGGYSHVPAYEIYKRFFQNEKPKGYFVFTIERNSYDKAISHWWWHTRAKRIMKQQNPAKINLRQHLTSYIESLHSHNDLSCWWRYTKPPTYSDMFVDRVYQYHEWEAMWKDLSERFSLNINMESTRKIRLKNSKKPFEHYRDAYKDNEQELVDQLCKQEIKHFNYEF